MKNKVKAYVASGGDADTPSNFAKAISDCSGVANTHVQLGRIEGELPKPTMTIPNLRFLHEFIFNKDETILARRIGGIGEGIVVDMSSGIKDVETKFVYQLLNSEKSSDGKPMRRTKKRLHAKSSDLQVEASQTYEEEVTQEYRKTENEILFTCDKSEHCVCSFLTFENYYRHCTTDAQCKIQVPSEKYTDKVMSWYAADFGLPNKSDLLRTEEGRFFISELQKSAPVHFNFDLPREDTVHSKVHPGPNEYLPMGDGLPKPKKNIRHGKNVHEYAMELFQIGLENNRKVRASEAVNLMQNAKDVDGIQRFSCDQWLDEGQVSFQIYCK